MRPALRAPHHGLWLSTIAAATLAPWAARAEIAIEHGGRIQTNNYFRVSPESIGSFYDLHELKPGVDRNENFLQLKLKASTERYAGVADFDLRWLGFSEDVSTIGDLARRDKVSPTDYRVRSLYLQASDLFIDGLDLRLGQQVIAWGVGDQFNPTNTLNAPDLEDPLLFGALEGNVMAKAEYTVPDVLSFAGVLVPVFKPALLPHWAPIALAEVDRLPHFDPTLRRRIIAEEAVSTSAGYPTVVRDTIISMPEPSLRNMQFEFRIATTIAQQDLALSYYKGFSPFPLPLSNFTQQATTPQCAPADATRCINGLLTTDVTLTYPRIQVAGLNAAGEVNLLGWLSTAIKPIGYRFELGVFFPQEQRISMLQGDIMVLGFNRPAGEYQYNLPGGGRPLVLDSTPFAKWTVGLDYTFTSFLYANVQWVHGFVDEIGAGDFLHRGYALRQARVTSIPNDTLRCAVIAMNGDTCVDEIVRPRLGDYLVTGVDIKFDHERGLLRLFTILDVTGAIEESWDPVAGKRVQVSLSPFSKGAFSAVLFPELNYNFGDGLELGTGALVQLGLPYTKFGDPASGGTLIWTRGRYSF